MKGGRVFSIDFKAKRPKLLFSSAGRIARATFDLLTDLLTTLIDTFIMRRRINLVQTAILSSYYVIGCGLSGPDLAGHLNATASCRKQKWFAKSALTSQKQLAEAFSTIRFSGWAGTTCSWAARAMTGCSGALARTKWSGSTGNDLLRDDSSDSNIFLGGAGNDRLFAFDAPNSAAVANTMNGGAGRDLLISGLGNSLMQGGAGNDTLSRERRGRFHVRRFGIRQVRLL